MRDFLHTIHADLPPQEWKIDCTRLAPYTPQENPVEDLWLKVKPLCVPMRCGPPVLNKSKTYLLRAFDKKNTTIPQVNAIYISS